MAGEASSRTNLNPSGTMRVKESRRSPRRVYQRPLGVLCLGKYNVVQAMQLSEGGLLFTSEELEFAEKAQVVVSLIMPTGHAIVARAEVLYSLAGGTQFAVKFVNLPIHLRRAIRNYVSAKTQAEAEAEAESDKPAASKSRN